MRLRALILGGAAGVIAACALALALPRSGAGRDDRRSAVPIEQFSLTIPGTPAVESHLSATDFNPELEYRFVISGTVRQPAGPNSHCFDQSGAPTPCADDLWDGFYHYGGACCDAGPGGHNLAKPVASSLALFIHPLCWPTSCPTNPFAVGQPDYPAYSETHTYDFTLTGLTGHVSFSSVGSPGTGSFTVQIYEAGKKKVDFAASATRHQVLGHAGFRLITMKGLGQLVVPAPEDDTPVSSTSAKGSIKFSNLNFSPKDVLLLNVNTLTLRVTRGLYEHGSNGNEVNLEIAVAKFTGTKPCPVGSTGGMILFDGSPGKKEPDEASVAIPRCHLDDKFVNGESREKVAVAIRVE